jgi:hypothetical protein
LSGAVDVKQIHVPREPALCPASGAGQDVIRGSMIDTAGAAKNPLRPETGSAGVESGDFEKDKTRLFIRSFLMIIIQLTIAY